MKRAYILLHSAIIVVAVCVLEVFSPVPIVFAEMCFVFSAGLTAVSFLPYYRKYSYILLPLACACYVALFLSITVFMRDTSFNADIGTHIIYIPFKTTLDYIIHIKDHFLKSIVNIFGNLLILSPLGFLLPATFPKTKKSRLFLPTVFALVLCVEITQLITEYGIFDIDDFIFNIGGAWISFIICKKIPQRLYMPDKEK